MQNLTLMDPVPLIKQLFVPLLVKILGNGERHNEELYISACNS